jgi:DNA-binding GntR family transcriptional regulator
MTIQLKTANELVYDQLRARIVRNELAPGAPLVLVDLAAEFEISTMPVRSALSRLQAEGLVSHLRHRGATVAPLEIEDLEVIQAARQGIEGFAALTGAPAMSQQDIGKMHELWERGQRDLATVRNPHRLLEMQWVMHELCYQASGRPRLLELIRQYRQRAERYLRLVISQHAAEQLPLQERFVEACTNQDGEAARYAMCNALAWTVETLRPVIRELEADSEPPSRSAARGGRAHRRAM